MVTIYDNTPTFATANLSHFQSGLGRIWGMLLLFVGDNGGSGGTWLWGAAICDTTFQLLAGKTDMV